jgi:hypothetical protein
MRVRAQHIATATLDIIFGRLLQAPILSQQRRGFYRAYCASDWPANASIILMASAPGNCRRPRALQNTVASFRSQ